MSSPKPVEPHGAFGAHRKPKLVREPVSDAGPKHPTEQRLIQRTPKGNPGQSKIPEGEDSLSKGE